MTEDRGQMTEDRRQMTEDRRQKNQRKKLADQDVTAGYALKNMLEILPRILRIPRFINLLPFAKKGLRWG